MTSAVEPFQDFNEGFKSLLETDLTSDQAVTEAELAEIEQGLRQELLNMLDSLADQDEALRQIETDVEEASRSGNLVGYFNLWKFLEIDDPNEPGLREFLRRLPNAEEILALFDEVIARRAQIVARKEAIDKAVLDAWRVKHPTFSSMGIIDSDIQSEALKDTQKLARR